MERDGQGWPVRNGRRLPQVLVHVGRQMESDAYGVSVCWDLRPDAPKGLSFYQRGAVLRFWVLGNSGSISWRID